MIFLIIRNTIFKTNFKGTFIKNLFFVVIIIVFVWIFFNFKDPSSNKKSTPTNDLQQSFSNLEKASSKLQKSFDKVKKYMDEHPEYKEDSELIKSFFSNLTIQQIQFITQDNPTPIYPGFIIFPFGPKKLCTEENMQNFKMDLGSELFSKAAETILSTGYKYDGLYAGKYKLRIIEFLKFNSNDRNQRVLTWVSRNMNEELLVKKFEEAIQKAELEFKNATGRNDLKDLTFKYAAKYPGCIMARSYEDYRPIFEKFR